MVLSMPMGVTLVTTMHCLKARLPRPECHGSDVEQIHMVSLVQF